MLDSPPDAADCCPCSTCAPPRHWSPDAAHRALKACLRRGAHRPLCHGLNRTCLDCGARWQADVPGAGCDPLCDHTGPDGVGVTITIGGEVRCWWCRALLPADDGNPDRPSDDLAWSQG